MSDEIMMPNDPNQSGPLAVVAVGGHALTDGSAEAHARQEVRAARRVAQSLIAMLREGYRILVVHGNGPQVGRELIRSEEASTKLPPQPMDVAVASTQGTMGYLLQQSIQNVMKKAGLKRNISGVLTRVLVNAADPAFQTPTKPVGPHFSGYRAQELKSRGKRMVEDAGRGWRQVVPSPYPIDIIGVEAVETLLNAGHLVVAGGGGGIPVRIDEKGDLSGIEGVIDKDRTAALFANLLGADLLVFLTAVDNLYTHFGQEGQTALEQITKDELREYHDAGLFQAGTMAPKVEACLNFLDDGGSAAVLTTAKKLPAALADRAGTRIVSEARDRTLSLQIPLFHTSNDAETSPDVSDEPDAHES